MKVLVNEEIPLSAWRDIIEINQFASPFQTWDFYNLFINLKDATLEVVAVGVEFKGKLIALAVITLQKESGVFGYFTRRGIIYGGPLIDPEHPQAFQLLLKNIPKLINNRAIYIEVRNFFDYKYVNSDYVNEKWQYVPYLNIRLYLKGLRKESVFSNFKYNRRREIKQSLAENASFDVCSNLNQLKEIYNILKDNYDERVKLPLPKYDYFEKFFLHANMKAFVALHKEKVIGGAFCPVLENKGLYTFYYCGLRDYHKRIFPTHLAIIAAIEYCLENNIPYFDFMGAGKPEIKYGVRQYKSEFGGELVEYGRYIKVIKPLLYRIGKIGIRIFSKLYR